MRKTVYEIVDNQTGLIIETFSYNVKVRSGIIHEIVDSKTGKFIQSYPFSIRVRSRLTDIDEYEITHVLLHKPEV